MELLAKHREDYLEERFESGLKPLGLYLHIPFCVRKCCYCDFTSFPGQAEDVIGHYVDRLCEDIAAAGEPLKDRYHVDTVFIGGGTPSLLSPRQLSRILRTVDEHFFCGCEFAAQCGSGLGRCDGMEVTLESNPGTFDAEKLRAFAELGVNRLSMGVQSLDDGVLRRLGRIHDAETALKAMRTARQLGLNYNVDLMLGIPGQSLAVWEDTLKRTLAEEPKHVSFYSLQLEMGTPFYRDFKDGKLDLPSWEENRAMYHRALEILKAAGYEHYEVSNAAKGGYACRHNLKYWTMQDYLGLGLAAHSFLAERDETGRILRAERSFTEGGLNAYLAGTVKRNAEPLEAWDLKTDFVFTELRLIEGFRKAAYSRLFGSSFEEDFGAAFEELKQKGLMAEEGGFVRLSPEGLDQTNPVMEVLLNV
ncbi:MAG: radical SAM family heme chaperone HemW [Clostridia bacterium]|nr:radical SAM family heme chaperone HemW [Clostridia bacterium]